MNAREAYPMSPDGSSERIAFLRREIARIKRRNGMADATAPRQTECVRSPEWTGA